MGFLTANWKERTKLFVQSLTDLAFPPICVGCQKPETLFCPTCYEDIYWLNEAFCPYCLNGIGLGACCDGSLTVMYTAVAYVGPIPKAIHHLKYEGHFALAKPLAQIMITAWQNEWQLPDRIIPIPLHKERQRQRAYNQSTLLVDELIKVWPILFQPDALFRVRKTAPQVGLNVHERQSNVTNAFWANDSVKGKSILLIDDVFTTGATMQAAAQALIDAGAKEVQGFAIAKATLLV